MHHPEQGDSPGASGQGREFYKQLGDERHEDSSPDSEGEGNTASKLGKILESMDEATARDKQELDEEAPTQVMLPREIDL